LIKNFLLVTFWWKDVVDSVKLAPVNLVCNDILVIMSIQTKHILLVSVPPTVHLNTNWLLYGWQSWALLH